MLSVFDKGPFAPCPTPFNMAAHVLAAGQATPDKIALSILKPTGAERWSYAKLTAAILGTARGLLDQGLTPGQQVLMRLGNTVDFPIAFLGALAAGLVPVPTSAQLTAPEIEKMSKVLDLACVVRDETTPCPDPGIPAFDQNTLHQWRDLPAADYHFGDPERLGYIVFTSGTSGIPRAVGHAHRAIWARQMMMKGWYGLTHDDRLCHAGAFNWTFTLGTGLMDPWTMGATALVPASNVTPDQLPLLIKRNEATIFAAVPGVYRQILKQPNLSFPKLRHGLSAGEKLPQSILSAWQEATGTPIFEAYGMSECSTFISTEPTTTDLSDGYLGKPQVGRRIAILGDDGPVELGEPGQIAIHNSDPGLMLGYIGAEEETKSRFQGDWFTTGDLGAMESDGRIRFLGRNDDMMNAGGFRVSPVEVENALLQHAAISEVGATDIEVKEDVRLIAAFFVSSEPLSESDLRDWCAERLARYKQPRIFVQLDALPKNPNGKLLRKALRDIPRNTH